MHKRPLTCVLKRMTKKALTKRNGDAYLRNHHLVSRAYLPVLLASELFQEFHSPVTLVSL